MPTVWSDYHLSPILLILRRCLRETKDNGRDGRLAVRLRSRRPEIDSDVGPQLR